MLTLVGHRVMSRFPGQPWDCITCSEMGFIRHLCFETKVRDLGGKRRHEKQISDGSFKHTPNYS